MRHSLKAENVNLRVVQKSDRQEITKTNISHFLWTLNVSTTLHSNQSNCSRGTSLYNTVLYCILTVKVQAGHYNSSPHQDDFSF